MPLLRGAGRRRRDGQDAGPAGLDAAALPEDAVKSVLTQRKGASLTLQSGTLQTAQNELSRVGLTLAEGSLVAVDPGQRINLAGIGQITLNGTQAGRAASR